METILQWRTKPVQLLNSTKVIFSLLSKLEGTVGPLEFMDLPDLNAVNNFRKLLKQGILKDVPLNTTKQFIKDHYPEFFI